MCKDMLKTTAKAVQQALLGWTVPISTGRRKKLCFLDLQNRKKNLFHRTKWFKKNTMELPGKRTKKDWNVPKHHVWCTLYQRGDSQMSTPPRAVSGRAGLPSVHRIWQWNIRWWFCESLPAKIATGYPLMMSALRKSNPAPKVPPAIAVNSNWLLGRLESVRMVAVSSACFKNRWVLSFLTIPLPYCQIDRCYCGLKPLQNWIWRFLGSQLTSSGQPLGKNLVKW